MKAMKTEKEARKGQLIGGAVDGHYKDREVAVRLHLSMRQVKRLKAKYRKEGPGSLIHGNRGRHPGNRTKDELRQQIVSLRAKDIYKDSNFTYFRELLEEDEHIQIGYAALCAVMKQAHIRSPKTHRKSQKQLHHREPKDMCGELLQTDASPYDWLGVGKQFALHGFQDDATGNICGLYMQEHECFLGYAQAFRPVLVNYGVPAALYADRIGVFFVNNKKQEHWTIEEQLAGKCLSKTQFGYIADDLGCEIIPAGSPQAKGRIERLWQTLQGRLPTWLDRNGISTMEAANETVPQIISWFNARFGHEPADPLHSEFSPLPKDFDLDTLLAVKAERKTDSCGCFSYQHVMFQIDCKKAIAKKQIVFLFSEKIGFKALYQKTLYPVKLLDLDGDDALPKVTRRLLYATFFKDLKAPSRMKGG
jgi:transposase